LTNHILSNLSIILHIVKSDSLISSIGQSYFQYILTNQIPIDIQCGPIIVHIDETDAQISSNDATTLPIENSESQVSSIDKSDFFYIQYRTSSTIHDK
jgi:hypothetical protein